MVTTPLKRALYTVLLVLALLIPSAVTVLADDADAPQLAPVALADPAGRPATQSAPPLALPKARFDPVAQVLAYAPANAPEGESKWIDVDLSEQLVVAYENGVPLRAFVISSGLPQFPTVKGTFRIWAKTAAQTMSGGSRAGGDFYNLPNVQWVSYFYQDYGLHGAYWHDNFGQPMSHGCVNMRNEDAEWLFFWSGPVWSGETWVRSSADNPGTLVIVHD